MTGAILAGGQSRRMGFNKAFMKVDGRPIIERTVEVFGAVFEDVIIIANDILLYERLGVRVASDLVKGAGSLGGIYTALFHSRSNHVFVAACDMPFLNPDVIKKMITPVKSMEAVVPFIDGTLHPMHALYSKRAAKTIKTMIDEGNLRIKEALEKLRVKRLTEEDFGGLPAKESVMNVNTREEFLGAGLEMCE